MPRPSQEKAARREAIEAGVKPSRKPATPKAPKAPRKKAVNEDGTPVKKNTQMARKIPGPPKKGVEGEDREGIALSDCTFAIGETQKIGERKPRRTAVKQPVAPKKAAENWEYIAKAEPTEFASTFNGTMTTEDFVATLTEYNQYWEAQDIPFPPELVNGDVDPAYIASVVDGVVQCYTEYFPELQAIKSSEGLRSILQNLILENSKPSWENSTKADYESYTNNMTLYSQFLQIFQAALSRPDCLIDEEQPVSAYLQFILASTQPFYDACGVFPASPQNNQILTKWVREYGVNKYKHEWKAQKSFCPTCRKNDDGTTPKKHWRKLNKWKYNVENFGWHLWCYHPELFHEEWKMQFR